MKALAMACWARLCYSANGIYLTILVCTSFTQDTVYYLQISGGNTVDANDFELCLTNSDFLRKNYCIINQSLSVDPPPMNGMYGLGQEVHVCLNIMGYWQ